MYYRARFYDSQIGRFTSEDPIGFRGGDVNLYGYVWNNPIRFADPWGTQARSDRNWYPGEKNPKTGEPYGSGDGPPNRGSWSAVGALGDFIGNYNDMRTANTIGADKFFHCMANCEASRRGFLGYLTAGVISEAREWFDQYVKGDPDVACNQDRFANQVGQAGGWGSQPCSQVCSQFRPNGLVYPISRPTPSPVPRSWGGGGRGW
jgi:uncharacterized protein RhaS with RHS repeats